VIDGKRVVAWTPFGREKSVSILIEYIRREVQRGLIDEYVLYMNTGPDNPPSDREYGLELGKRYDWVTIQERPETHPGPKQRSTGFFYRTSTAPDTVYIRLDDDVVYLHEDAIANLVKTRLEAPEPVAIFGTTWNNAIVSWFMQQQNPPRIPTDWTDATGRPLLCDMYCMDTVGWANGEFAVRIHELLLEKIEQDDVESLYLYQDYQIKPGTQFSVSYFASLGSLYAGLDTPGVLVPDEEESFHTVHEPLRIGVPNLLIGNSIVSHYTFQPQQPWVVRTNILDRYRKLAEKLT
jgi:hypothetical protein